MVCDRLGGCVKSVEGDWAFSGTQLAHCFMQDLAICFYGFVQYIKV